MKTHRLLFVFLGVAILGVGCPSSQVAGPSGAPPEPPAPPKGIMAFGKLPALGAIGQGAPSTGMMQARSAAPAAPATAPATAPMMEVKDTSVAGFAGVSAPSVGIVKSIPPIPPPRPRPVTVEYLIEGALPTWGSEDTVRKSLSTLPDISIAKSFSADSGIPTEVVNGMRTLVNLNVGWQDADDFSWTFDAAGRSLNAWKQEKEPSGPPQESEPKQDDKAIIAAADRFLDAHGFASIRALGGIIQKLPEIMPMMGVAAETRAEAMPCIMNEEGRGCGWWPQTVSVQYPLLRDGRAVVDAWGSPQWGAQVTVRLADLAVQGASIQLSELTEASAYPLIDQETAKRRLLSGGRNPVYPWGNETKNITVRLTKIELVWIQTEDWAAAARTVYWMPGLRASGTVDHGIKGAEPEPYQTVIPLLADDAFAENKEKRIEVPMVSGNEE